MVHDITIEPAVNGFFVTVFYRNRNEGAGPDRVFCRSTAQINALLKDLFPKEKKVAE